MIEMSEVSKVYRTAKHEVRALDNVSLRVEAGQLVAIRGPSGAGKSTLLSVIAGLSLPTQGKVMVDQQPVHTMSAAERSKLRSLKIGFVFQIFHLLPYLNVEDNILLACSQRPSDDDRQRMARLIDQFQLGDRRRHRPGELSIGERQRVAMARALLNQPQVLLADEPTGNLDDQNAALLLETLLAFQQAGGTTLLVTHDQRVASAAQSTIQLQDGKIVGCVE